MANLPIDTLLAKTISMLSADMVQKANSGHPGLPMGAANYAAKLWSSFLKFNPDDSAWINRDRFVLSAGHGSALLYSLLHLFGYKVSLDDIKNFRQWESITPGHPEFGMTDGVECTTGPLGQGFANAVGLALSGKLMQQAYSKELFNYNVFALVSDGDVMEGVASEAASFAAHMGLDNLIYLYDDNSISLAGETKVCFTESVPDRMKAYGFHVQAVNADDTEGFARCLQNAIVETGRPSFISVKSIIGFGSPAKQNSFEAHGSPLGEEELKKTKENIGWNAPDKFFIPDEVKDYCSKVIKEKQLEYDQWQKNFEKWRSSNPSLAAQLSAQINRTLPEQLKSELASGLSHTKKEATRSLSGKAIQVIAKSLPNFIGGSADLEPSTKTLIKDSAEIQKDNFNGRNLRYGVREHAMGAIANGLAYTKSWIPYTATFLVFSDYMRPTIRLAALSHLQTFFIFTHDSFWVGEDGPTHEPIEHIEALRAIPNLLVFRPADGIEVGMSYYSALSEKSRPSALIFTRQDLVPLERDADFKPDNVLRGGYVIKKAEAGKPEKLCIISTGSEVALALDAARELEKAGTGGVRVVSMPCVELFAEQAQQYQDETLGTKENLKIVTIEAGTTNNWKGFTGRNGLAIGIDHYGASAPGEVLAEKFGFTAAKVVERIKSWNQQS